MSKMIAAVLLLLPASALCQGASAWNRAEKTDAFSGKPYIEYQLAGKFIQPPHSSSLAFPVMIVRCVPGIRSIGYHLTKSGMFGSSFFSLGAVLDQHPEGVFSAYRRDEGEAKVDFFSASTDGTAVFFSEDNANQLFYGHDLRHRENSTPAVKKLVMMFDEAYAAKIVVQFDIPDPSQMAEDCGLVSHKK